MQLGVVFPQTEIGNDPIAIRDYVQAIEGMGYHYLMAYDHVLGANPERLGGWSGPYTHHTPFHEVFVLFGWLAALTTRLEFATGILVLPQRQTALVAKQAVELDILSGGRLRLGIGVGWNHVEFQGMGEDFSTRGKRSEEQVEVLHQLWSDPLVKFEGEYHHLDDVGLNPMPPRRIPLWFGGGADVVLRRMARWGDGWMANSASAEKLKPRLDDLRQYLTEAGRNWEDFGIDIRLSSSRHAPETWPELVQTFGPLGATHLSLNTMDTGYSNHAEHLAVLRRFIEEVK